MKDISYREWATAGSLGALLVVGGLYFSRVFASLLDGAIPERGDLAMYAIWMIGLLVAIEIAFHIVLAVGLVATGRNADDIADEPQPLDERDRLIDAHAYRNAYYVADVGALIAAVLIFQSDAPHVAVQYLLLALVLAQLVKYASRLWYYRRGL